MALTTGATLGPYEIVSLLGSGGMGEVYHARDPRLGRNVAVKVLPPGFSSDAERLRRFEQEARAAAALNHPHILAVYDIGSHGGAPYIVSELLEGDSLSERLKAGPLPVRKAVDYAVQIARGLAAAHEKGIVHRDLKPGNIFITADSRVKILDFGLAKLIEREPAASGAADGGPPAGTALQTKPPDTMPGIVLGTIGYMSPEQVRGRPADHRSDIFAFGTILYEMLAGQRAFRGESSADTMTAILKEDPPDLPTVERHIPPALARIIDRCLEKSPTARFQSAGDLAFALDALTAQSGATEAMVAADAPPKTRDRLAWTLVVVLSVVCAMALAFGAVAYLARTPPDTRTVRFVIPLPSGWVPAGNVGLTVSPDGRRIAFVARSEDGKILLWVRALDTLTAQPLTGTDSAVNPFWSPDGRFLGFFAGGKLKKIDASGGPPITLCDSTGSGGGTWSPEGTIVFAPSTASALQRVSAVGGLPTPVTVLAKDEAGHSGPFFLPDGRHFFYSIRSASAGQQLWSNYVGSIDSSERTRVPNASWPKALYSQGHVLFPRESTMMAQPFDPRRMTMTGEPFPVAEQIQTLGGLGVGIVSVSENGVLAYQTGTAAGSSQLTWFDRGGKPVAALSDRAEYSDVRLSPDGKRAAVTLGDFSASSNGGIWIVDLVRGLRTRFTFRAGERQAGAIVDLSPVWSPDGGRIAFGTFRGHLDIYQKLSNGAGGEEVLLANDRFNIPVSWSPDGRFILYLAAAGPTNVGQLWVLPLFGDRKPFPYLSNTSVLPGQFSPDGRWIAYVSNETGRNEVYIAPFPGPGGKWLVSTAGGVAPRWRRDGKELFYVGPDGRLMAAAVNGQTDAFDVSSVQPLFDPRLRGVRYTYDVTADGQRFLASSAADLAPTAPPMTVVLNWAANLRK